MPLTIRVPFGGGIGAVEHHSESPEAYFAHTAGLRVVTCSNPADAHRMIQQAVAGDDPVVFFEPKRRYWDKGDVDVSEPLDAVPLHQARVVTEGTDVTVATYGSLVSTALDAARDAAEDGTSVEVVDLRSLSPVDFATLEASVRKTGRLVVAHEAPVFCGFGAEVAARVSERCFYHLEAPVVRVGGYDTPYPASKLEVLLPARCRPHPRRGRSNARTVRAVSPVRTFRMPDLGEGLADAEIVRVARRGRRRRDSEPDPRRG